VWWCQGCATCIYPGSARTLPMDANLPTTGQLVRSKPLRAGLDAGRRNLPGRRLLTLVGHVLNANLRSSLQNILVELLFSFSRSLPSRKCPPDRIHAPSNNWQNGGERSSCSCQRPTRKLYRHQASSAWTPNSVEGRPRARFGQTVKNLSRRVSA